MYSFYVETIQTFKKIHITEQNDNDNGDQIVLKTF